MYQCPPQGTHGFGAMVKLKRPSSLEERKDWPIYEGVLFVVFWEQALVATETVRRVAIVQK